MKYQIGIIYKKIKIFSFLLNKGIFRRILKTIWLDVPLEWFFCKFERLILNIPEKQINFFSQFLKDGDLCFDIGAWEGEYTEVFLKLGAKVVAVEPQQDCIKKLNILFGKNNNVKIVGKAVGDKIGRAEMAICETSGHSQKATLSDRFRTQTRHSKMCKWTKMQLILITTLDSLINQYGVPKFCKIDVEGYEESVIKGLSSTIRFISFEFHKELLDIVKKCCIHLSKIGKVRFNCIIDPLKTKLFFSNWVSEKELNRELNSQVDPFLRGDIYVKFISND